MDFTIIEAIEAAMDHSCITNGIQSYLISIPEAAAASTKFEVALESGDKEKLDEASGMIAAEYERQGFINGFRAGMKLALEVLGKQ